MRKDECSKHRIWWSMWVYTAILGVGWTFALATPPQDQFSSHEIARELVLTSIEPCRVLDTRQVVNGVLLPGEVRTIDVVGEVDLTTQGGESERGCGVPGFVNDSPQALAVLMQYQFVGAAGDGQLIAWASDRSMPEAPTLVFAPQSSGRQIESGILTPLRQDAPGRDISLNVSESVDVVAYVIGYYVAVDNRERVSGKSFGDAERLGGDALNADGTFNNLYVALKASIGQTTAALQTLDVAGRVNVRDGVIQRGGTAITATTDLGLYSRIAGAWMRFVVNAANIAFYVDGASGSGIGTTPAMTIQGDGRVAIGPVTTTQTLHVATASSIGETTIGIENKSTGGRFWQLYSTGTGNAEGAGNFMVRDGTAAVTRLFIDTLGNLGIGTTTPTQKLTVAGNIALTPANSKIIGTTGLMLEEAGDVYGGMRLGIVNRFGQNGALFEQLSTGAAKGVADFVFKPSADSSLTRNLRLENRPAAAKIAAPEFQIGAAGNPTLVVSDTNSAFLRGNVGIGGNATDSTLTLTDDVSPKLLFRVDEGNGSFRSAGIHFVTETDPDFSYLCLGGYAGVCHEYYGSDPEPFAAHIGATMTMWGGLDVYNGLYTDSINTDNLSVASHLSVSGTNSQTTADGLVNFAITDPDNDPILKLANENPGGNGVDHQGLHIDVRGAGDALYVENGGSPHLRVLNDGRVFIGGAAAGSKLGIAGGDIQMETPGFGVILRSPNNSCFRVTVTDAGALTTTAVPCS